ncbi:Putative dipeptidase SA1572 [Anaerotruncus sp. 2789STDY5834896]|uniref:Putative dipeptidase SA1572 n=1 Tax=uncultured Anaerotruncus sp. TaxID=905011 RepID=A0A1C6I6K5_9FIRM|nr:Putative dipeptidase SA1572 [uncultured Anaerotruncus sp.]
MIPLREIIEKFIDDNGQQLLHDLGRLVAIPSVAPVSPQPGPYPYLEPCAQALDYMLRRGSEIGLAGENIDYRCGVLSYGDGDESIAIAAHLDVVPAGDGWTGDPFSLRVEGDTLYGRGVNDNKGSAIMGLYLMKFLQENQIPLKHKIQLILGCDEETGMTDMPYYLSKKKAPAITLVPDGEFPICVGEKGLCEGEIISQSTSDDSPILSLKGGSASNMVPSSAVAVVRATGLPTPACGDITLCEKDGQTTITAAGVSAHASTPDAGDNAIGKLVDYLLDCALVEGYEKDVLETARDLSCTCYGEGFGVACADETFGKLTCICGTIKKDEQGQYAIGFNIRWPMAIQGDVLKSAIELCCGDIDAKLQLNLFDEPHYVDPEQPAVQALKRCYEQVTGEPCGHYVISGATYARYFPMGLTFGPMFHSDIEQMPAGHGSAHQPDEMLPLATLKKALAIYIDTIAALDGIL